MSLLVIFPVLITTINSCKKEKTIEPVLRAEKTDVRTYEIVSLILQNITLSQQYNGNFGNTAIQLQKTSDTTLTFMVPEIPNGSYALVFDLGKVNFNVTQTQVADPASMATTVFQKFDNAVLQINTGSSAESAKLDSIINFKEQVVTLFNSLTAEQKNQAMLIYEANKAVFQTFSDNVNGNFDAPIAFKKESECPKNPVNEFYICTADNLGNSASDLITCSKKFLKIMALALVSSQLAPANVGVAAVGIALATATGGYILWADIAPAWEKFSSNLDVFCKVNWIFTQALFQSLPVLFTSDKNKPVNLDPKYRPIQSSDNDISQETDYFLRTRDELNTVSAKLPSIFETIPPLENTQEPVALQPSDVTITVTTNTTNVQVVIQSATEVKFKSISGNTENFKYKVKVDKGGWVEEKTVDATVNVPAVIDTFSTSTTYIFFGFPTGGTNTFNIMASPTVSWQVSSNVGWLSTTINSGSGNATIPLTATENPNDNFRTGLVKVSATGFSDITIHVSEEGNAVTGCGLSDLSVTPNVTGNTATAIATGGVTPYAYQWSTNAIVSSISNLQTGDYTVTVTDAQGCTVTASATVLTSCGASTTVHDRDGNIYHVKEIGNQCWLTENLRASIRGFCRKFPNSK